MGDENEINADGLCLPDISHNIPINWFTNTSPQCRNEIGRCVERFPQFKRSMQIQWRPSIAVNMYYCGKHDK